VSEATGEPCAAVPLRHGYTIADLDTAARTAALTSKWRLIDYSERVDVARFAIVERLLAAADRPDFWQLVGTGQRAIRRHVDAQQHWHGIWLTHGDPGTPMVRFHRYWQTAPTRSAEGQVVDVLALRQIWPKLTRMQQAALLALARTDDYEKAAAELGVGDSTLRSHLSDARVRFLQWWHQHEQPSRPWRSDIRKRATGPDHRSATSTIRRRAPANRPHPPPVADPTRPAPV
jgi:hypothetical protein